MRQPLVCLTLVWVKGWWHGVALGGGLAMAILVSCVEQGTSSQARPVASAESLASPSPSAPPLDAKRRRVPSSKPSFVPPESALNPELGQSKAARRILEWTETLRDSVRETKYQGRTVVRPEDGYYAWDCSGMSAWLLKRTAPAAVRALEKRRPVAKDFFRMIDKSPTKRARRGWQKLGHVADARPGDLFTWLRSPMSKSRVSGHVGFFITAPTPHPKAPHIYTARIMDATSLPHGQDTRPYQGEGGFGFGTMLFATDESGTTVGYGWHGERSLEWGVMPAEVIYGRVTK